MSSETAPCGLLLHLFSLANFFRGVMPAVTPKATRPDAPWGPGDKDQEKGLSARSPKALRGLEKVGSGERAREAGQEARERTEGWRHVWMDGGGRKGGWMDGWTDELMRRRRGSSGTAADRQTPKRSKRCRAEGEGTRGVGRGAQKWGAWETRGEDCCGWGKLEAGAEGAEAGGQQARRNIKASRCGGR